MKIRTSLIFKVLELRAVRIISHFRIHNCRIYFNWFLIAQGNFHVLIMFFLICSELRLLCYYQHNNNNDKLITIFNFIPLNRSLHVRKLYSFKKLCFRKQLTSEIISNCHKFLIKHVNENFQMSPTNLFQILWKFHGNFSLRFSIHIS